MSWQAHGVAVELILPADPAAGLLGGALHALHHTLRTLHTGQQHGAAVDSTLLYPTCSLTVQPIFQSSGRHHDGGYPGCLGKACLLVALENCAPRTKLSVLA